MDTSVWIRRWRGQAGYALSLERLLRQGQVCGHALIHGELLAGDTGGRASALRDYRHLPWLDQGDHDDVAASVQVHGWSGRGVGWIDLHLLFAARAGAAKLWTADQELAILAQEQGVGWVPERSA